MLRDIVKKKKVRFFGGNTEGRPQYLCLIKGQEEVGGPGQDASGAVDEVIPSGNGVWIGFQHWRSLDQFSAGIFHSEGRKEKKN